MSVVVLCEKKSQADAMQAALGFRRAGPWMQGSWKGQQLTVVWARGHLFEQASPDEAVAGITWSDPKTLLPVPSSVKQVLKGDTKKQFGEIRDVLKNASECWIATDPDREGEAIARIILGAASFKGGVKRLWLVDGMDPPSIKKAYSDLKPDSFSASMYEAQRARAMADWQAQILTRAMTMAARHGLLGAHLGTGSGKSSVASVGRVQTPTLKIVVDRDLAIENFTATTFYTPFVMVKQGTVGPAKLEYVFPKLAPETEVKGCTWYESEGGTVRLILTDLPRSQAFEAHIRKHVTGPVQLKLDAKKVLKKPPVVFSLTMLQAAMNKRWKISAKNTLAALSDLYLKGYVSYPRTERDLLPMSAWQDARSTLEAVSKYPGMAVATGAELFTVPGAPPPPVYTKKEMEHHGLMPTTTVPVQGTLSSDQQKVYAAVVERFIQAHYPAAQFEKATITLALPCKGLCGEANATYATTGERCIVPGWMALFGMNIADTLPALKAGEAQVTDISSAVGATKPPPRFTQASLLLAMLNAGKFAADKDAQKQLSRVEGIGTPATRDTVIETLFDREYLIPKKDGKTEFLMSTPKGRDLISHGPARLMSVDLTAEWESEIAAIEELPLDQARLNRQAFIDKQTKHATAIIDDVIARMGSTAARPNAGGFNGKPTPKMVDFARKLAEKNGLAKLPKGVSTDATACRAFIEKYKGASSPSQAPSQAPSYGATKPHSPSSGQATGSSPIKGATQAPSDAPSKGASKGVPTEKQIAFAKSLSQRKGVALPAGYDTDMAVCRAFLEVHAKG